MMMIKNNVQTDRGKFNIPQTSFNIIMLYVNAFKRYTLEVIHGKENIKNVEICGPF